MRCLIANTETSILMDIIRKAGSDIIPGEKAHVIVLLMV